MQTLSPNSAIIEKTRELCSIILQSSEYTENVEKIDAFFSNEEAQTSYRQFAELGEKLQKKQQEGTLQPDEIASYETALQGLREDPVTSGFMQAEEALNGIVKQISKQVGKTLELGRLPEPEDLEDSGGCCGGGGCGF